jgi:hypothetical protein
MKFDILRIFLKICRENSSFINSTRRTGALQDNLRKLMVICSRIILGMVNLPDKVCRKQNPHFAFNDVVLKIFTFME